MWAFPNVYHGKVGNSCYKYFIEVEQFSDCKGSFNVVNKTIELSRSKREPV